MLWCLLISHVVGYSIACFEAWDKCFTIILNLILVMNWREGILLLINIQGDNEKSCMDCYKEINHHMFKCKKGESLNKFCTCFEIRTPLHYLNVFGSQMTELIEKYKEEYYMT